MSTADEDLVVAEKVSNSKAPSLLTGLAIAGVVVALVKLGSFLVGLPWLINPKLSQGNAAAEAPAEVIEYQQLMVAIQGKYLAYQLALYPLGILVAGLLLWASFRALQLRPHGDLWIKCAVIASTVTDLLGAVIVVLMQMDIYHALQTVFQDFDSDDRAPNIMYIAMNVGFYIGIASAAGFLLLQFGYYFMTLRYFSKPEVRALYQEHAPNEASPDV
ncbi:hypothetical protein M4951_07615 [Blastopirellula sp. J2-11]|uniref:hypothetical protein n=1 Tax=Blastopirellula sp. J2-11 TaxID=2943192 RepID=UPI0021C67310|nr:hypothetical protein [Blastopirellula sp. J2-11]UUO08175.1 hypothetical protein M4951_07615 [Blastopirellula sp. J2-11]